jgi:hypothetical protein
MAAMLRQIPCLFHLPSLVTSNNNNYFFSSIIFYKISILGLLLFYQNDCYPNLTAARSRADEILRPRHMSYHTPSTSSM